MSISRVAGATRTRFASDMTELPPTAAAAAALGQQAAGLIAKVAGKEPSIQNYMHSALDVGWGRYWSGMQNPQKGKMLSQSGDGRGNCAGSLLVGAHSHTHTQIHTALYFISLHSQRWRLASKRDST